MENVNAVESSGAVVGSDLLRMKDAADFIGVTVGAIRNAVSDGRLPHVLRYGVKLIEPMALEEYRRRTQPEGVPTAGRPSRVAAGGAPE